jgi:hypothetical protein
LYKAKRGEPDGHNKYFCNNMGQKYVNRNGTLAKPWEGKGS